MREVVTSFRLAFVAGLDFLLDAILRDGSQATYEREADEGIYPEFWICVFIAA